MPKIVCNNAQFIQFDKNTNIAKIQYPANLSDILFNFSQKSMINNGGFYHDELSKVRKSRTTGRKSQNHAINGYAQQIAIATWQSFDTVKMTAKYRAISRGYEYEEINVLDRKTGMTLTYTLPKSESDADTIQAGYIIDELILIAAEQNIILKE